MIEVMNIEGSCYEDDEDGNERERGGKQKKELTKILDTVYTKKADHQSLRGNPAQG